MGCDPTQAQKTMEKGKKPEKQILENQHV